jgi:hypothetical protein
MWFYKLVCKSLIFFFVNWVENITWNFKEIEWSIQYISNSREFNLLFHNYFWLCRLRRYHLLTVTVLFVRFKQVHRQWVESGQYSSRIRIQGRACEGSICNKTWGRLTYFSSWYICYTEITGWLCWILLRNMLLGK